MGIVESVAGSAQAATASTISRPSATYGGSRSPLSPAKLSYVTMPSSLPVILLPSVRPSVGVRVRVSSWSGGGHARKERRVSMEGGRYSRANEHLIFK